MTQLNAFIARSFAREDEERIRPLLEFLETFRKAGFICEEAEAAEVESVSKKVQRMIQEKDVFIGFLTRRHPVCSFKSKGKAVLRVLLGDEGAETWSAPAWVLQESGYALGHKKSLILLRELGVENFGLQGDLEYIPFDPKNPAEVYPKLSEMINDLLAKSAGKEVKVTVAERPEEKEALPAKPVSGRTIEKPQEVAEKSDIVEHYIAMIEAAERQDFKALDEAWASGKRLINAGSTKDIDALTWDCLYFEQRFEMGASDAIENLRRLRAENPERPEPRVRMAGCLLGSDEFEEAAQMFLEAAPLQEGEGKARSLVGAAKAFQRTKQYKQGLEAIKQALSVSTGGIKEEAVWVQYQLLSDSSQRFFAFATAEAALHENPLLPLRFSLGLDYHRAGLHELGLSHFQFLNGRNKNDSGSLHNLALMYSACKLPINSVKNYRLAISKGGTLAAANLGFMYLDGGMVEEAKALLREAMKIENHDAGVEGCLANISQREEEEKKREVELLEKASNDKGFLVRMGEAMTMAVPPVEGNWKFPFGEMPLRRISDRVEGSAEIKSEVKGLAAFMVSPVGEKLTKTSRYSLRGTMTGSVCEFQLRVGEVSSGLLGALGDELKSGFIVFLSDGKSATYIQLSDGKLERPEKVTKVG